MIEDASAGRQHALRFGYTLITVLVGTMTTGIFVILGLSVSWCFVSPVSRCFSVSKDAAFLLLRATEMWFAPALVVGILIAMTAHFRGIVVWWIVLLVAVLVAASVFLMASPEEAPVFFLAESAVLFVGIQLSRWISRLVGRFPI